MTPDHPPDRPVPLSADEEATARWLEAQRVAPSPAFRARGRRVVQAALHDRVTRRRAAVAGLAGWIALGLAAAIVALGT